MSKIIGICRLCIYAYLLWFRYLEVNPCMNVSQTHSTELTKPVPYKHGNLKENARRNTWNESSLHELSVFLKSFAPIVRNMTGNPASFPWLWHRYDSSGRDLRWTDGVDQSTRPQESKQVAPAAPVQCIRCKSQDSVSKEPGAGLHSVNSFPRPLEMERYTYRDRYIPSVPGPRGCSSPSLESVGRPGGGDHSCDM